MGKTRRFRGAGYLTDAQFFGAQLPPAAGALSSNVSMMPTATEVRPVMLSTFQPSENQMGGRSRRGGVKRGGFSPSLMGSFVANAQAAIVPLALYMVYHTMVPKKDGVKDTKGGKTRKAHRKNSRKTRK
jgi:hypothetical protein